MEDQSWDEAQGIIHMANEMMLSFLHLLGVEDGCSIIRIQTNN